MVEAGAYCDHMNVELTSWRNEVCELLNAVEAIPEQDKTTLSSQISTVRDLVSDLTMRIDMLKAQCPTDWGAISADLKRSVSELVKNTKTMWDVNHIAGGYVGG